MTDPVRILLLDDHRLFREGLARLLSSEPGLLVVGQCGNINEAIQVMGRSTVDMILLDFDLGKENGIDFLRTISVLKSRPQILMVTAGMPEKATRIALGDGAVGIVLKHSDPDLLLAEIRRAATQDRIPNIHAILQTLSSQLPSQAAPSLAGETLTRRQSAALRGVLNGLTNRQISQAMNISVSSVKAILQELFRKAGVRTRGHLVAVAVKKHHGDWLSD